MNRSEVLDQVKQTICNDRQDVHGNPENTHQLIADFWNTYVRNMGREKFTAQDVAVMMVLFKVARHAVNPMHLDNLIDAVGYGAIAAELSNALI